MSSHIQTKLLTLLNVSLIKRPLDVDVPGAIAKHPIRRSTSAMRVESSSSTESVVVTEEQGGGEGEGRKRKRKSVMWMEGMESGPSGSGMGGSAKSNGKGKGKKVKIAVDEEEREEETKEVDDDDEEESNKDIEMLKEEEEEDEDSPSNQQDTFSSHFAISPSILTTHSIAAAESDEWVSEKKREIKGLGKVVEVKPGKERAGEVEGREEGINRIVPSLLSSFSNLQPSPSPTLSSTLSILGTYKDLFVHGLDGDADGTGEGGEGKETEDVRRAGVLHGLNHVMKTRRKIIKNNEKLAHQTTDSTFDARDQSFTRPKVLFLLPFRSSVLHYLKTHLFPLAPPGTQIENKAPFEKHFSLPEGTTDPLDPKIDPSVRSKYANDHIATFHGNSDDSFRLGIKITRKSWRLILPPAGEDKLIDCDILIASPLAIRMGAEREGGTDLLSSIEVVMADGLDVMAMQNWDHVQYVFDHLNQIPVQPHGCDFSRVKPWYSDNQAKFLRQSILISRFETPEMRALFRHQLFNLEGKIRLERTDYPGVLDQVRKGVKQVFVRLQGEDPLEELDVRFKHFVDVTLPSLLKSAISRTNTLILVPSYFDFVRVTNHLREMETVDFAAISEYSSNQEISRARTSFFKGKKAFLVITERFHFYRRYRLRGAKTIVFYSLPDHAQFYAELMAGPFIPSATGKQTIEVDEAEVTARVAFSKWDWLKLERIVGTDDAKRMVSRDETKYTFV